MIKVCHVTSAHPPEDGRIFLRECCSLAEKGYSVHLVQRGTSYTKNDVFIEGFGMFSGSRLKRMVVASKKAYLKALEVDAQIYHLHDPELLLYALRLKRRGKAVVFDSHELYRTQILEKEYLPRWFAKIASFFYKTFEEYVLKRIDGVIFPCLVDGIYPLPGKDRVLINNLPSLNELYDRFDENAPKNERSVCMVGTLSFGRGVSHFIRASHRAKCHAFIAGKSNSQSFEMTIRQMHEAESATFLGYLGREDVRALLQRSLVGSAALLNCGQYSHLYNLPTKAYEYMSMGIPVVLSKTPYNNMMVDSYHFGICVDPENIEEYAEALRYLIDNPDEARKMGSNGRTLIKNSFNWEFEVEKLIGLYNRILDRN